MATITGYTAARMKEIEDSAIVDGTVLGDDLILTRFDGATINAGSVRGPQGLIGPTGDVSEAPEDGKLYVRRNGAWEIYATTPLPQNNITHGLRNNVWTPIEVAVPPPVDGNRYSMRDGSWVRQSQPWTLTLTNTTDPVPTGFLVGSVTTDPWSLTFSGSEYHVNYHLKCTIYSSSDVGALTRFTLPPSLRPNVNVLSTGYLEHTGVSDGTGITTGLVKTNGTITLFTQQRSVLYQSTPSSTNYAPADGVLIQVFLSGSYTRSTVELPTGATVTA